jgi:hypothetical protein
MAQGLFSRVGSSLIVNHLANKPKVSGGDLKDAKRAFL